MISSRPVTGQQRLPDEIGVVNATGQTEPLFVVVVDELEKPVAIEVTGQIAGDLRRQLADDNGELVAVEQPGPNRLLTITQSRSMAMVNPLPAKNSLACRICLLETTARSEMACRVTANSSFNPAAETSGRGQLK